MLFKRVFILPFLKNDTFKKRGQANIFIPNSYMVASCLNAAFYLSHDIRRDTVVFLLFEEKNVNTICLKFVGKNLKRFQPDERSILGLIRNSITKFKKLEKTHDRSQEEIQIYPGLFVFRSSLSELLSMLDNSSYEILYPSRKGVDVRDIHFSQKTAYITSTENLVDEISQKIIYKKATGIHFGNTLPRMDIQIILLHNELDRLQTNGSFNLTIQ